MLSAETSTLGETQIKESRPNVCHVNELVEESRPQSHQSVVRRFFSYINRSFSCSSPHYRGKAYWRNLSEEVCDENDRLIDELERSRTEINLYSIEKDQFHLELKKLKLEVEQKCEEMQMKEKTLKNVNDELEKEHGLRFEVQERNVMMNDMLKSLEDENEKLKSEVQLQRDSLQQITVSTDEKIGNARSGIAFLEEENAVLTAQIKELQNEIEKHKNMRQDLQNETVRKIKEYHLKEITALKGTIESLTGELDCISTQNGVSQNEITQLKDKMKEMLEQKRIGNAGGQEGGSSESIIKELISNREKLLRKLQVTVREKKDLAYKLSESKTCIASLAEWCRNERTEKCKLMTKMNELNNTLKQLIDKKQDILKGKDQKNGLLLENLEKKDRLVDKLQEDLKLINQLEENIVRDQETQTLTQNFILLDLKETEMKLEATQTLSCDSLAVSDKSEDDMNKTVQKLQNEKEDLRNIVKELKSRNDRLNQAMQFILQDPSG